MDSLTAESHAETLAKVLPLLEEGRFEEALPFLELHKSKADEPIWSYLMALCLACLARGDEGLPLLEKAAQAPGYASHFGIPQEANSLVRTTALNHLMFETSVEALAISPWVVLGRFAELLNHREFQAKALVGRMKLAPESPEVVEAFLAMFEDAPPDKVIPILDDIVNSKPHACQPRALLGSFLQQRGKTALAIRHLKTALESDPNAMEPHLYLGKIYLSQQRFDEAEKELSEAMAKGKKPTVALLIEVANCQRATYRYDEALQTLFDAFEIHPPTFRHWDQLVDTAQNTGNAPKLVDALRRAADRFPDDARLRQRFAMVAYRQGEPLAARDQLRATGIFENPTKDPALARLASEVALALGEPGTAVHLIEALWKAAPQSPETCRLYGEALINDGRVQEAETLLRETAKNNPNDRALQTSWGRALLTLGDAEKAHRAFGLASRLDPDDAEAMAEQGRAMLLLGLHDEAQNVLKESAKKADPPLAVTLTGLGAVYERKNLKDISRDFYRQALIRQPDRLDAACGMLRTRSDDAAFPGDAQDLASQVPHAFGRLRLWLTLLRASFIEGLPQAARALKDRVYPEIFRGLTDSYRAFMENSEVRVLTKLSKDLETDGEPEKAREIWRYAVSSPLAELSQRASGELKRLDSYESASIPATAPVSPQAADDDPLASLLGNTIPAGNTADSLFAAETPRPSMSAPEADLFADESAPATAAEDVPLFSDSGESTAKPAASGEDMLDALFALDTPVDKVQESSPENDLFAPETSVATPAPATAVPTPEDELFALEPPTPSATAPAAEIAQPLASPEDELFAPSAQTQPPAPVVAEPQAATPADDLFTPAPSADDAEALFALESPVEDPISALLPDPTSVLEQPAPTAQPVTPTPPAPSVEDELFRLDLDTPDQDGSTSSVATPAPVGSQPDPPAAPTPAAQAPEVPTEAPAPIQSPAAPVAEPPQPPVPPEPVPQISPPAPVQVVREELLPIPMAADFSPLTRRQLHYHEALATSGSGVVSPESLAHLLLQSVVGHEPPDPGSQEGASSVGLLQKALVASATELENAEQFRGAVRVLRTALLYQPDADEVLEALARVQSRWAEWLAERNEFAHAVSLMRDSLMRQPDNDAATGQLEAHYQSWMDWSEQSGDPAARDLLAVYLEQERNALDGLRQEWEDRRARVAAARESAAAQAAAAAAKAAAPPVAPVMPLPTPAATPAPAPPIPAVEAAAPAAVPPAAAAPVPAPPAVPAAPAAATAPPTAEPAPVATAPATPPTPAPAAAPPTAPTPAEAPPAAAAPVPAPVPVAASPSSPATSSDGEALLFSSKEEAMETLDAAPEDEGVAEGVFAIYADSMRDLTTILKDRATSQPDQPSWLLWLARAFRRSGSETMAVIQYQKYIKVAPSPEAYEELAQTYEQLGKDDFAKMTRRKAERG